MAALAGIQSKEAIVFLISMLPVLELRGGFLAASWLGIPLYRAAFACIGGCLLPVPFILLLILGVLGRMKRYRVTKRLADYVEKRAMGKSDEIRKYEFWGLMLFVGIPLPGTGAWTGSLIAALLGIRFSRAVAAIFIGVLISAALMAGLSYGILDLIL